MTVDELLKRELEEMATRYGPASTTLEAAYYHTSRAKHTLDAVLLAKVPAGDAAVVDRLVHLAAVCTRLAKSRSGEEVGE